MLNQSLNTRRPPSVLLEVAGEYRHIFARVQSKDISESGVLVRTAETPTPLTEFMVRFVLPVAPQDIAIESAGAAARALPGVNMTIVFMNLREEQRRAIATFVTQSSAGPTQPPEMPR
ncbi:MAG: hypothetical protein A3F68_12295 [Acidobacteria bacterium RIFCSPLOWO2_12_FULL_54_10]|nr:MAG: hypothetical protein A3F68_12295 [Acidobacteria bacterium RIFCSPLOWO2_12_FULL_54_10]